jgi:O-antigen/teichoic acid export membrane protein
VVSASYRVPVAKGQPVSVSGKIWRGTAFMSGANVLARVGTFLGNLAIIRLLGLDLLGELGLIENWLNVAMMFAVFGVDAAVTKYVSHHLESEPEQVGEVAATALALGAISSILVGGILFVVLMVPQLPGWALRQEAGAGPTVEVLTQYAVMFPVLIALFTAKQLIVSVFYGLQTFQVFVWANLVIGAISFPVSYLLVRWQGLLGALEVRAVLAAVEVLLLVFPLRRALRRLGAKLSLESFRLNSRRLLAFGLPTFVGQLVANPVQPLMLSVLAAQPGGIAQVGLITTAQRLSSLASFVPGSMAATVMPVLSTEVGRGDMRRFRDGILVALRMLWLSTLPVVLLLMAACPTLLGVLYGPEYVAAWAVTLVFLMIAMLVGVNQSADRALAAANRMWLSTANNLSWALMFIPLALVLVPRGLALGYALAFFTSFALYVVIQLGWLRRLFRVQLVPLLPLLAFSVLGIAAAWVIAIRLISPVQIVAAGALVLLTLFLQWRLFLSDAERQALQRQVQQLRARGLAVANQIARAGKGSDADIHGG